MKNSENDIKVSVICTAYNHSKYIRQCLDGFVMQKTNFKFEVLVHDDASTDDTADIIREYEAKYPEIIKPIYQTENQYSKGVKISTTFLYPNAKGKYFAYCEGDDYWCDENKLQTQYDVMEAHPECSMCVHRVKVLDGQTDEFIRIRPVAVINKRLLSPEDYLALPQPAFQLSSYFFKKDVMIDYVHKAPDFFKNTGVGDVPMTLWGVANGNVAFVDKAMSCYHALTPGSWTVSQKNNPQKMVSHIEKMFLLNKNFNEYTNYKYKDIFEYKLRKGACAVCKLSKLYKVKSDLANELWLQLTLKEKWHVYYKIFIEKIKNSIKKYIPFVVKIKRKIVVLVAKNKVGEKIIEQ